MQDLTPRRILIIGQGWPEPEATAAGLRMIQLLRCFKDWGGQIVFAAATPPTAKTALFEALDIETYQIELNSSSFDALLAEIQPAIVVFDRFMTEEQYGWRVASVLPGALRILNTEDLHSLRVSRSEALKRNQDHSAETWFAHEMTKRELASIYRSDQSLIISNYEMELLQAKAGIPGNLLFYLPFIYDSPTQFNAKVDGFNNRSDFVFVGNGKHAPNLDAIQWLHDEVWPLIRQLVPEAKLNIYGAYLPDSLRRLHSEEKGFCIKGRAADIGTVFRRSRVNLVPLRFGAGIKGKLVEAMRVGLPSISTPIGLEGLPQADFPEVMMAGDASEIATVAAALYTQQQTWDSASEFSLRYSTEAFDYQKLVPGLYGRLETLLSGLDTARNLNIIGAMLMHHRLASTRYMAKWIEAKRKKTE